MRLNASEAHAEGFSYREQIDESEYLYDIDDRLPLQYASIRTAVAFIMFPVIIIAANLGVGAFNPGLVDGIRFLQLSLLTSGVFTVIQTLWGHHYPLLEGLPRSDSIVILLAPGGLLEIKGNDHWGSAFDSYSAVKATSETDAPVHP